jgi:hypothetical protein
VLQLRDREAVRTGRAKRRERSRLRRELRDRDRCSAKLAELHNIDELLAEAAEMIDRGWIQDGWFAYDDATGIRHTVTAYAGSTVSGEHVAATCLVGAIVHAGGGPSMARSQPVQRTLDLTWHALYRGDQEPIRWCPSPGERAGHVQDLAHWNDSHCRGSDDVTSLLDRARGLVDQERRRTRAALTLPVHGAEGGHLDRSMP